MEMSKYRGIPGGQGVLHPTRDRMAFKEDQGDEQGEERGVRNVHIQNLENMVRNLRSKMGRSTSKLLGRECITQTSLTKILNLREVTRDWAKVTLLVAA